MANDESIVQEQQQIIGDAYRQLGERFYADNRGNAPEAYADVFATIRNAELSIETYEAEQRRLKELEEKGLILCPFCGEEIVNRSVFCNFCGRRLSDYNPTKVYVKNTAEEAPEEKPAEEEPAAEETAAEEELTTAADTAVEDIREEDVKTETADTFTGYTALRTCSRCGFQTDDLEAMFCNNCGARLPSVGAAEATPETHEKHCPFCGFRTSDADVLFCIECGARMV